VKRRDLLATGLAAGLAAPLPSAARRAPAGAAGSVLRVAFNFAETGFDPPRVSDASSRQVNAHIFESPLTFDLLARPARLVPQTAAALPEISADAKHFVFTLKPGIFFADDPVFQGRRRELVAADYVYSIKRFYDPALKSEHLYQFENAGLLGLSEVRQRALKSRTPFDYDAPVDGLRVLDRYRFELRLARPAPRLAYLFADPGLTGAVAREVIEAYVDDPMAHPVGTGPFRLARWRRASAIVLERNPGFREQRYDAQPPPDDAELVALAARLKGRRLPLIDRVEISIIEEAQPRWLAFLNGEIDMLTLPPTFGPLAMPGGRLAPFLARRGVQAERVLSATTALTFFNCADPLVGGLTPDKVALRRAVALAFDSAEDVRVVLRDQAVPANQLIPPGCYGHDPALRSELTTPSPARARALLDMHGYTDRNADGWRETPQGQPLVLRLAFTPTSAARASSELWLKRLRAVGLRVVFEFAPFGELIKRSLAGQLMMWGFSWSAPDPDGDFYLGLAYGPNADQSNDARFALPAYDRVYEQQRALPDGPERLALMHQANKLMLAYMPYMAHNHAIVTDLMQPHVRGPLRHAFNSDWFRWADVHPGAGAGAA
jgi:ABC-type transport system substrate-binding protein